MVKKEHKVGTDIHDVCTSIAVMNEKITTIKEDIETIKDQLERHYVTQEEFKWVRNIVYGMVSLILIAVLGAIVRLVVTNGA